MKKVLFFAALAAIVATSCKKDTVPVTQIVPLTMTWNEVPAWQPVNSPQEGDLILSRKHLSIFTWLNGQVENMATRERIRLDSFISRESPENSIRVFRATPTLGVDVKIRSVASFTDLIASKEVFQVRQSLTGGSFSAVITKVSSFTNDGGETVIVGDFVYDRLGNNLQKISMAPGKTEMYPSSPQSAIYSVITGHGYVGGAPTANGNYDFYWFIPVRK